MSAEEDVMWDDEEDVVEDVEEETVEIVRFYANGHPTEVIDECTLAEAKEHCENPETSWKTCTTRDGLRRTELKGPWFDGWRRV